MSRREKVHEVSSPISLFPFIGILLCTMGALLVVLVAVSRSARDTAHEQVASGQTAELARQTGEVTQKIAAVTQYVTKLNSVRSQGKQALSDEQRQLAHLDDHVRRLTEQFRSLELAAAELAALEEEHYDDQRQAEREVERLHQLVTDTEKSIAEQREEVSKNKHSYAVVPYEGPNGTFRRPIYLECRKGEIVLQPEGVSLSKVDLRPPYGAGSPLAVLVRTARDHYIRLYPGEGQSRDTEPYPLLIVRPEGLALYRAAQSAIEAADFDFGIELAETDWELTFPTADAKLTEDAELAVKQARLRQEVLAEAAPRAYRHPSLGESGEFEFDEEQDGYARGPAGVYVVRGKSDAHGDGGLGGGGDSFLAQGNGNGGGGGGGGGEGGDGSAGGRGAGDQVGGGGTGGAGTGSGGGAGDAIAGASGTIGGAGNGGNGGPYGAPSGSAGGGNGSGQGSGVAGGGNAGGGSQQAGGVGSAVPQAGGASVAVGDSSSSGAAGSPALAPDTTHRMATAAEDRDGGIRAAAGPIGARPGEYHDHDPRADEQPIDPAETRGQDWAFKQKAGRSIPVRRTIHVVVRNDRLAILPEDAPPSIDTPTSKVVPLKGDTVEAIDDFVGQVRDEINGWGIAGEGLYWRPVLVLTVGPDGQRRADDLARLLKNSGLELKADGLATKPSETSSHETR